MASYADFKSRLTNPLKAWTAPELSTINLNIQLYYNQQYTANADNPQEKTRLSSELEELNILVNTRSVEVQQLGSIAFEQDYLVFKTQLFQLSTFTNRDIEVLWKRYADKFQRRVTTEVDQDTIAPLVHDLRSRYETIVFKNNDAVSAVSEAKRTAFSLNETTAPIEEVNEYKRLTILALDLENRRLDPRARVLSDLDDFYRQVELQYTMITEGVTRRPYSQYLNAAAELEKLHRLGLRAPIPELKAWKEDVENGFSDVLSSQYTKAYLEVMANLVSLQSAELSNISSQSDRPPTPINFTPDSQQLNLSQGQGDTQSQSVEQIRESDLAIDRLNSAAISFQNYAAYSYKDVIPQTTFPAEIAEIKRLALEVERLNPGTSYAIDEDAHIALVLDIVFLKTTMRVAVEHLSVLMSNDTKQSVPTSVLTSDVDQLRRASAPFLSPEEAELLGRPGRGDGEILRLKSLAIEIADRINKEIDRINNKPTSTGEETDLGEETESDVGTDAEIAGGDGKETEEEDIVDFTGVVVRPPATRRNPVPDSNLRNVYAHVEPAYSGMPNTMEILRTSGEAARSFAAKLLVIGATTDVSPAVGFTSTLMFGLNTQDFINPRGRLESQDMGTVLEAIKNSGNRIEDLQTPKLVDSRTGFADIGFAVSVATALCLLRKFNQQQKVEIASLIKTNVLNPLYKHMLLSPVDEKAGNQEAVLDMHKKSRGFYLGIKYESAKEIQVRGNRALQAAARAEELKIEIAKLDEGDPDSDLTVENRAEAVETLQEAEDKSAKLLKQADKVEHRNCDDLGPHITILLALLRDNFHETILRCTDQKLMDQYTCLVWYLSGIIAVGILKSVLVQTSPFSAQRQPWVFGAWIALDKVRKLFDFTMVESTYLNDYMNQFKIRPEKGNKDIWLNNPLHKDGKAFDNLLDSVYFEFLRGFSKRVTEFDPRNIEPIELARDNAGLDHPLLFLVTLDENTNFKFDGEGDYKNERRLVEEADKKLQSIIAAAQTDKGTAEFKRVVARIEKNHGAISTESLKYNDLALKITDYPERVSAFVTACKADEKERTKEQKDMLAELTIDQVKIAQSLADGSRLLPLFRERRAFGGMDDQPRLECIPDSNDRKWLFSPKLKKQKEAIQRVVNNYLPYVHTRCEHVYLQTIWLHKILLKSPTKLSAKEISDRAAARKKLRESEQKRKDDVGVGPVDMSAFPSSGKEVKNADKFDNTDDLASLLINGDEGEAAAPPPPPKPKQIDITPDTPPPKPNQIDLTPDTPPPPKPKQFVPDPESKLSLGPKKQRRYEPGLGLDAPTQPVDDFSGDPDLGFLVPGGAQGSESEDKDDTKRRDAPPPEETPEERDTRILKDFYIIRAVKDSANQRARKALALLYSKS